MNSWRILRLNPQNQPKFCDHVAEFYPDTEIYYPVYEKISRPARKRTPITIECPVFPGYLFVCTNDIASVYTSPVRVFFVRLKRSLDQGPPSISTIPDTVIQELRRLESLKLLVREERRINPYLPGTPVRVHLPVADITAVIMRLLGHNRVAVDSTLGRMTVPLANVTVVQGTPAAT